MKPSFLFFLIIPVLMAWSHVGEAYQELKTYRDLKLPTAHQKAWIIFDIDNTLLRPQGVIGSVEWAEYMRERYIQAGYTPEQATQKQHALFGATQTDTRVKLVDDSIFSFLQSLPRQNNVFALTARNPNLTMMTLQQMSHLFLLGAMEANFPKLKQKPAELSIERGIIFANSRDKGEILELMLQNAEVLPEAIYFFDDKIYNVEAFDKAMERVNSNREQKIAFQSYYLTAVNQLISDFDPKDADSRWYQFRYLGAEWFYSKNHPLISPIELAKSLLSQQILSLSTDAIQRECRVANQTGNDIKAVCTFKSCLRWDYDYDGESQCRQVSEPNQVTYDLQYLPDLQIYIRSGWEFLKHD